MLFPKLLASSIASAIVFVLPFSVVAKVKDAPEAVAAGRQPNIVCDSLGQLHLAFEKINDGRSQVYYCRSNDEGKVWTKPIDLSPEQSEARFVHLATDRGETVNLVWNGRSGKTGSDDLYFARSNDGGKSFSAPKMLFKSACSSSGASVATAADGSIHILWCEAATAGSERKIYYSRSTDAGVSWSDKQTLAVENQKEGSSLSSQPTLTVSTDGTVHAAWVDIKNGGNGPDIFYAKCQSGASVWTKPIDVSKSSRIAQQPVIASGRNGKVFLSWVDNSRKELAQDIWCSLDHPDASFSPPFNISDTPGVSSDPAISADRRGRLAIVWSDTTSGTGKPDIYGRISLDSLADYSNLIDFSNTEGRSHHPSAAIGKDRLFVVWQEDQDGSSEIFLNSTSLIGVSTGATPLVDQKIHGASSTAR